MIDHKVVIGGEDVSEDVISVKVQQSMDTDSDPGKFTITLANPAQKYTMHWFPQTTGIVITLYNWVYNSENERAAAGGKAQAEYLVVTGTLTELKASADEVEVSGEDGMGHMADAIGGQEYNSKVPTTPREVLREILDRHDTYIELDWDDNLKNDPIERKTYRSEETFQDVIEDIRDAVGAVAYFSEDDKLVFRDPFNPKDTYDLNEYVTNPDQTASILGFRNYVIVKGDESLAEFGDEGLETHGTKPIIGTAMDLDSIAKVGMLWAPPITRIDIKDETQANKVAADVLQFYKMYKNAQTVVEVEGILPPIQSIVEYSPFIPISGEIAADTLAYLKQRLKELQDMENLRAIEEKREAITLTISSNVRGIVVNREIEYSIEGMHCKLTISPGLLEGQPITDEDISGSVFNSEETS